MCIGAAGETRARLSAQQLRHFGSGLASVLLHAAALGGMVLVVTPSLPSAPPDETVVELVFAQPAPLPASEAQPELPKPEAAVSPEPAPPPPATAPPRVEQAQVPLPKAEPAPPPTPEPQTVLPSPPKPELVLPRPLRPSPERRELPKPKPPPPQRTPPRPVANPPMDAPAPRAGPAAEAPEAARVAPAAPVVDPRWEAAVSGWLAARKAYPEEARRRGEEGNVLLRLTVDRSGRVLEAAIVRASGSTLLDEAALGLLRQATLPAFPADMAMARITIMAPLRYSLR